MIGGTLALGGDGKEACEGLGINPEGARKCGQVSRAFETGRRRPNLKFSHHQEIYPIEDESMQDKLLDWAESEKATVKALRSKVQAYMAMADWAEPQNRPLRIPHNQRNQVSPYIDIG